MYLQLYLDRAVCHKLIEYAASVHQLIVHKFKRTMFILFLISPIFINTYAKTQYRPIFFAARLQSGQAAAGPLPSCGVRPSRVRHGHVPAGPKEGVFVNFVSS